MILFAMKEGKVELFFRFLCFYVVKQAFYSILTTQYSVPLLVLLDLTPCFCRILPNTLALFPEIGSLLCL